MTRRREGLLVMTLFIVAMLASGMFWAVLPAEYRENQSTDYALAYELYDASGKLLIKGQEAAEGITYFRIDMPPLAAGVYFLRLLAAKASPTTIERMPYGAREFYVSDPNGNELAIVEFALSDPGYTIKRDREDQA